MNEIKLLFADKGAQRYDQVLQEAIDSNTPDHGDVEFLVKEGGMASGRSSVMITFTIDVDGKPRRVQTVTSLRLLAGLVDICTKMETFEADL